jgi:suppressor of fused protein SUFU
MQEVNINIILWRHLRTFFTGHECEEQVWTLGPAIEVLPQLRVAQFAPGPRSGVWVYATVGTWEGRPDHRLEFLITAPHEDLRHVELLAMTAWYHHEHELGLGHTFPIGEPWLPGSLCDHMLVSLPYPFGPSLEVCELPDGHLHYF